MKFFFEKNWQNAGDIVDDDSSYFTPQTKITWMMRGVPCPCWEMASWSRNLLNQQEPLLEPSIYVRPELGQVLGERDGIKMWGVWSFQRPLFKLHNVSPTKLSIS